MNRLLKGKIVTEYGSQVEFAEKIRMNESDVSRVVRGHRTLSVDEAEKWSRALGCDIRLLRVEVKSK